MYHSTNHAETPPTVYGLSASPAEGRTEHRPGTIMIDRSVCTQVCTCIFGETFFMFLLYKRLQHLGIPNHDLQWQSKFLLLALRQRWTNHPILNAVYLRKNGASSSPFPVPWWVWKSFAVAKLPRSTVWSPCSSGPWLASGAEVSQLVASE